MTHPFENLDPAQTVQVLPRHLAGPGAVDPRSARAFPFDEGWPFAQTAPEGLGGVRHRYAISGSSGPAWRSWGGYPSEPHWTARFSFGTPTTLVAAFTASLISTEPLHRTVHEVPVHTRRALYIATTTPMQPHGNTPVAPPPPAPVAGRTR